MDKRMSKTTKETSQVNSEIDSGMESWLKLYGKTGSGWRKNLKQGIYDWKN